MRILTAGLLLCCGCAAGVRSETTFEPELGVSWRLAEGRARTLSDIHYQISFMIPQAPGQAVTGSETVTFTTRQTDHPVVLDFNAPSERVLVFEANGTPIAKEILNGHFLLPAPALRRGVNTLRIEFLAGDRSLNRNPDFLYTLLVPDRASTVFPCFDQPNLKARFQLHLEIPHDWRAVSNTESVREENRAGRYNVDFAETALLPTYLFAFAAGKFEDIRAERDGRTMRMFHRETDAAKVARNADALFDLHAKALRWLEDYTAIPYPFGKFDFVLIPSFQYNGMEHPGSIFYRANSLLLEETAIQEQQLERASVIAHETAHMWFGDLVTITWFDDVWMKEVFANFMAAKIVQPSFPGMNHELRFLMAHYPAAYAVDRTTGTHPIRQKLDNLREAGTLYGPIIYKKAPIVLAQLESRIGEAAFRDGVRKYLETYRWGNASWPDLIRILKKETRIDLEAWSRTWVEEEGRPNVHAHLSAATLDLVFTGRVCPQQIRLLAGESVRTADLDKGTVSVPDVNGGLVLPFGYGLFNLDAPEVDALISSLPSIRDPFWRGVGWITLWENLLEGRVAPARFLDAALISLESENNELIAHRILGYVEQACWRLVPKRPSLDEAIWALMTRASTVSMKSTYFRAYRSMALTPEGIGRLTRVWSGDLAVDGLKFSEVDFIAMSLDLAVRGEDVLERQRERIKNPDLKARFEFVMPALSPDPAVRAAFFVSLKDPANRAHEPWVLEAVMYLHHPLRAGDSEGFISPSLEWLEEIQRTGDIFFPERWLEATLGGHASPSAERAVQDFLRERPSLPPRLRAKVLQSLDGLSRAVRIREIWK